MKKLHWTDSEFDRTYFLLQWYENDSPSYTSQGRRRQRGLQTVFVVSGSHRLQSESVQVKDVRKTEMRFVFGF